MLVMVTILKAYTVKYRQLQNIQFLLVSKQIIACTRRHHAKVALLLLALVCYLLAYTDAHQVENICKDEL